MKPPRFVAGPLSVLCILALAMGTASAAVITVTDGNSNPDTGPVHSNLSPETPIRSPEEKEADVADGKAILQHGGSATVEARLEACFQTRPPVISYGAARSSPDLADPTQEQKIITRLEEEGVDITEVRTEFQDGDTGAVKTWLESYMHAHEAEMPF